MQVLAGPQTPVHFQGFGTWPSSQNDVRFLVTITGLSRSQRRLLLQPPTDVANINLQRTSLLFDRNADDASEESFHKGSPRHGRHSDDDATLGPEQHRDNEQRSDNRIRPGKGFSQGWRSRLQGHPIRRTAAWTPALARPASGYSVDRGARRS